MWCKNIQAKTIYFALKNSKQNKRLLKLLISMKKFLYYLIPLLVHLQVIGQVGINTTNPLATLDIAQLAPNPPLPTEGILIPRLPIFPPTNPGADQHSMLVYLSTDQNGINISGVVKDYASGFYYWSDTDGDWLRLDASDISNDWKTGGNTVNASNFLGTLNDEPLHLHTNGAKRLSLLTGGQLEFFNTGNNILIGNATTSAPSGSVGSVLLGLNASTSETESIVIGRNTTVAAPFAITIGTDSEVTTAGQSGIAIGRNASVAASQGTAVGFDTTANGANSVALGHSAFTSGTNTTALGSDSSSTGNNSIAAGVEAFASSTNSVAMGHNANVTGSSSIATGFNSSATGSIAIAIGVSSLSGSSRAIAIGNLSNAASTNSMAIGRSASASALNTIAIGTEANATNSTAIAIGANSQARRNNSIAIGQGATVNSANTMRLGNSNLSTVITDARVTADSFFATASNTTYADYVFEKFYKGHSVNNPNYTRKSLEEVEAYVIEHGHFPGIQSYEIVKRNGNKFNVSDLSLQLLEKTEEQFIYIIELKLKIEKNEKQINDLLSRIKTLEKNGNH